jgi:hypothetical protein
VDEKHVLFTIERQNLNQYHASPYSARFHRQHP